MLAAPARFAGKTITVVGTADVLTEDAMTMGEYDLIVLAADPDDQSLESHGFFTGDDVRATGTLRVVDALGAVERLADRSLLPPSSRGSNASRCCSLTRFSRLESPPLLDFSVRRPTSRRARELEWASCRTMAARALYAWPRRVADRFVAVE